MEICEYPDIEKEGMVKSDQIKKELTKLRYQREKISNDFTVPYTDYIKIGYTSGSLHFIVPVIICIGLKVNSTSDFFLH